LRLDEAVRPRRKWTIVALCLLFAALAGTFAAGLQEAVSRPVERRATLGLPGWPAGTAPLHVALLSDIHIGNRAMDAARLTSIVEDVNAQRPDLVLIAGDFTAGTRADGAGARAAALTLPLSRLRAPLGVVAVLGNHDYWTAPGAIRAALERAGAAVLVNRAIRRGPLTILGVDDAYSGHDDVRATLRSAAGLGGIPIVLTHSPDVVHRLGSGFPLLLAGHTHCGQAVLPLYGPILTHAPLDRWRPLYDTRYRCGLIRREGDGSVIVTAGLGSGTAPIRLGAPPDWWLLTLGPEPRR
jgi:predicted MPP superfamily phosphohydrolase